MTTILLSIPGNDPSVADAVAVGIKEIVGADSTASLRVIIHASRTFLGDHDASTRRRRSKKLLPLIADGRIDVWSAGLVGEAVDLLRPDEMRRLSEEPGGLVGTAGRRFFPHRIRRDQVDTLLERQVPLCIGYSRVPRPGTVSDLRVWDSPGDNGSRWVAIPTLYIPTGVVPPDDSGHLSLQSAFGTAEAAGKPVELIHLVLPGSDASRVEEILRSRLAEVVPLIAEGAGGRDVGDTESTGGRDTGEAEARDADGSIAAATAAAPSDGAPAVFVSGCSPYPPGREPAILAALDALRDGSGEATEDYTPLVNAAGDVDSVVDRLLRRRSGGVIGRNGNHTRELEGAGTGYFTLSEGPLRALFVGGRICDVSEAGSTSASTAGTRTGDPTANPAVTALGTNGTRAQGHLRLAAADSATGRRAGSPGAVHYLETIASAWFSSGTTRGVQEHAALPGGIVVDNESVVVDGVPTLLFGQTVSLPKEPVEGTDELVLFEISLGIVEGARGLSAEYLPGADVTCRVAPSDDPTADREVYVAARHLIVAPSRGVPIGVTPADRSGTLIVPYRLAIVPKNGSDRIVLRLAPPVHADPAGPMLWPEVRRWSVSFLFTPARSPVTAVVAPEDVIAEVPGFTADPSID